MKETALIVGAGPGLSSSLTTLLIRNDFRVALAARNIDKLSTLEETLNVDVYPCPYHIIISNHRLTFLSFFSLFQIRKNVTSIFLIFFFSLLLFFF